MVFILTSFSLSCQSDLWSDQSNPELHTHTHTHLRHIHRDAHWSAHSMVCASLSDQCGCASSLWAYVTEDQWQQPVFSSQCQPSLSLHHTGSLYNTTDTMITSLALSLCLSLLTYRHTVKPHVARGFASAAYKYWQIKAKIAVWHNLNTITYTSDRSWR